MKTKKKGRRRRWRITRRQKRRRKVGKRRSIRKKGDGNLCDNQQDLQVFKDNASGGWN